MEPANAEHQLERDQEKMLKAFMGLTEEERNNLYLLAAGMNIAKNLTKTDSEE